MKQLKLTTFKSKKKAQVANLNTIIGMVIAIGVLAVVAVIFAQTIEDIRGDQTENTSSFNTSTNALDLLNNLSGQWALIGTVIGLMLVVSVILMIFRFRGGTGI